jgi:nitroimidazol reductase NimA-like FMN-containing flavoprotein (pyridoxamine 5'-phosphate oxidase superfamily)
MGEKIEWMRSNPLVCVEADEVLSDTEWASVVVRGRYEEFPDTPEYAEPRRKAQSRLEKIRSLWWRSGLASAQTRGRFDRDIAIFYCIHVEQISGRRGSPDPAKQT